MSTATFVPFEAGGIEGLELSPNSHGYEKNVRGVVVRFEITTGRAPEAVLGRYGPRGGWYNWRIQGDEADLAVAIMIVREARDLVSELNDRWHVWMEANGYSKGGT